MMVGRKRQTIVFPSVEVLSRTFDVLLHWMCVSVVFVYMFYAASESTFEWVRRAHALQTVRHSDNDIPITIITYVSFHGLVHWFTNCGKLLLRLDSSAAAALKLLMWCSWRCLRQNCLRIFPNLDSHRARPCVRLFLSINHDSHDLTANWLDTHKPSGMHWRSENHCSITSLRYSDEEPQTRIIWSIITIVRMSIIRTRTKNLSLFSMWLNRIHM